MLPGAAWLIGDAIATGDLEIRPRVLDSLNVKDFGAVGDGTNDDSLSITAANNAAASANVGLFFPAGTYKTTSSVVISVPIIMGIGAILSPNNGTIFIDGGIAYSHANQQIFSGTGPTSFLSHTGTGPPDAITVTGNPLGIFSIQVTITTGGNFSYQLDSGGYIASGLIPSTFAIPGTAVTLNFAASVTYVENDVYSFSTFPAIVINVNNNSLATPLNPKWWGAIGDNIHDDTDAIQACVNNSVGRTVYLPNGNYKITQTIMVTGTNLRFLGEYGNADAGSAFFWHGPSGNGSVGADGKVGNRSIMFMASDISQSIFEHLTFVGYPNLTDSVPVTSGAQYLFWIRTPLASPGGGSTEVVEINHCHFELPYGPGSACLVIGDVKNRPGGGDISEVRVNGCEFVSGSFRSTTPAPNVSAATNTAPIQITTKTFHGLTEGQAAVVRGCGGNISANQAAFVHIIDAFNFTMLGTDGTSAGAYTSGGVVYQGGTFTSNDRSFSCSPIGTSETGVLISNGGNTKNFTFTNCVWRSFLLSGVTALVNSGSLTFVAPVMGFANGFGGLIADFHVSPLANLTVIGAETEGSARAVYGLFGGNSSAACCVLTGYSWNGYGVDYTGNPNTASAGLDAAFVWGGQVIMTGCQFFNLRNNFTEVPYMIVQSDPRPVGVIVPGANATHVSMGNYFSNATFLPFFDNIGGNNLVEWHDYPKGGTTGSFADQCQVISRGDAGGPSPTGEIIFFPAYEGTDLRIGPQQLQVQTSALSPFTPNFSKINSGVMTGSYARFSLSYTDAQMAAASNRLRIGLLPCRCRIINVVARTTTAWGWTSGSDSIYLSIGFTEVDTVTQHDQAFLLSHDIKTAAITKGLLAVDLGEHLAATAGNAFGYLDVPGWDNSQLMPPGNAVLELNAVVTSGGQNLSLLNSGHTDIYVRFEILPF
jgi:hypothetical protein